MLQTGNCFLICLRPTKINLLNLAFVWSFFNFVAIFCDWLTKFLLIQRENKWGGGFCLLLVHHIEDIDNYPIAICYIGFRWVHINCIVTLYQLIVYLWALSSLFALMLPSQYILDPLEFSIFCSSTQVLFFCTI